MAEAELSPKPPSLVSNERIKLTAAYLNMAAGSCFTAGVVAPLAAALFGVGSSAIRPLDFGIRRPDLLERERRLSRARPQGTREIAAVTDIQLLAFVITPLTALAFGAVVAFWAIRVADKEHRQRSAK